MKIQNLGAIVGCAHGSKITPTVTPLKFQSNIGATSTIQYESDSMPILYMSKNGGKYKEWDGSEVTIPSGEYVSVIGKNSAAISGENSHFTIHGDVDVSGKIASLFDYEGSTNVKDLSYLFYGCDGIHTTDSMEWIYNQMAAHMFHGCGHLVSVGTLRYLADSAKAAESMFEDCIGLTSVSFHNDLTSRTYAREKQYYRMFKGCVSLDLHSYDSTFKAKNINTYAFAEMFMGCTSLTTGITFGATVSSSDNIYPYACESMYEGCTSLTSASFPKNTNLGGNYTYSKMFKGCASLTTVPSVPSSIGMQNYTFFETFKNCTSLTNVSNFALSYGSAHCFESCFEGCTSLVTAPTLNSLSTSSTYEYEFASMFKGCTSLTTVPACVSSLTNIAKLGLFDSMFDGCSSLAYIETRFTAWGTSSTNPTNNWMNGVAATGTFKCKSTLDQTQRDASHIPDGWTIETY